MGATFIVTLREAFEAALLLGIVYTALDRVGGRRHFPWVTLGAAAGAAASVAAGVLVTLANGALLELGPDVVGVVVAAVALALITWHGWWMRQHARAIKGDVQRRLDEARASRRVLAIALIAFTGVFREGAETVLFLWGLASQASVAGMGGLAGGALGVTTAAVLGWMVFRGGRRISPQWFFGVTSVVLLVVAAGLVSTAIGKLESLGVLPDSPIVWDTSAALGDDGVIGGFLAGLTGYRARPTLLELTGYAAYLAGAGALFFARSRPSGALDERPATPSRTVAS